MNRPAETAARDAAGGGDAVPRGAAQFEVGGCRGSRLPTMKGVSMTAILDRTVEAQTGFGVQSDVGEPRSVMIRLFDDVLGGLPWPQATRRVRRSAVGQLHDLSAPARSGPTGRAIAAQGSHR